MKLTEAIGKRISNLLEERGLKPYYLFLAGGIPKSTISMILNCKVKTVKMDTVYQICATLDISLSEFFNDKLFENISD